MTRSKNKSAQQAKAQTAKAQSQTAKLEVPEGYKPSSAKNMARGRNRKSKQARAIEAAMRDCERAKVGQPPLQMTAVDKAALARMHNDAEKYGIDMNPSADGGGQRLVFNDGRRVWRSLENRHEFMKQYDIFQKEKFDPMVFADETTTGRNKDEVQFIRWFQTHRSHYYATRGREQKLRVLEKVCAWPNMPDTMTSAPLMRMPTSEHKYVENVGNRDRGLLKVLNEKDIAPMILNILAKDGFLALSNLSQTCHTALNIMGQYVEHWNTTPPGDFLGDDVAVDKDGIQGNPITLMVTPIRKPYHSRTDVSYSNHYETETKLYRALNNRTDTITNLQLHRVQFLNAKAVSCILASLPNLEVLGIYQCQLLHLGNMTRLLDAVRSNARKTEHGYSYVHLDFFPMYHQGPNSVLRHGSYGSVWNTPDVDMATGVLQLVLYNLYPQAMELGIDILKWGCAFRSFMEKLALPNWAIVRIYEAIKSFEYTGGMPQQLIMDRYDPLDGKWQRFIDDVTAAMRGDGMEPAWVPGHVLKVHVHGCQLDRWRKFNWWRKPAQCGLCLRTNIPAAFFPFGMGRCWGCLAQECLMDDYDHLKTAKTQAASAWFDHCRNLNHVTARGSADAGSLLAQKMDKFRRLENSHNHGYGEVDWPDHPNMGKLHRRYARQFEPHGPVDRMLADRQYFPIGHFETGITGNYVPACWPEFNLKGDMKKWESDYGIHIPMARRALARQQRLEECVALRKTEAGRINIIAAKNKEDAAEIERLRRNYVDHQQRPNRLLRCRDELIHDMFARTKINGRELVLPELLRVRRPKGALPWVD